MLDRDLCACTSVLAIDFAQKMTADHRGIGNPKARDLFAVRGPVNGRTWVAAWATERPPRARSQVARWANWSNTCGVSGRGIIESQTRFGKRGDGCAAPSYSTGRQTSVRRDLLLAVPDFTLIREWVRSSGRRSSCSRLASGSWIRRLRAFGRQVYLTSSIESLTLAETVCLLTTSRRSIGSWALPDRLREEYASGQARLRSAQLATNRNGRVYVEDIDSFAEVRNVDRNSVAQLLRNGYLDVSEETIQVALESILEVAFHKKDWGGEINDLYTANVRVKGTRTPTAFMLKGNGLTKGTMEVRDCGKNGDQVIRLFRSAASLFVIQFVGNISEAVIHQAESEVARLKSAGQEAYFLILDGQDTARLMHAYAKL